MTKETCFERLEEFRFDNGLNTMSQTIGEIILSKAVGNVIVGTANESRKEYCNAIACTLFPGLVLAHLPPEGPSDIGDDWYSVTHAASGYCLPPGAMRLVDAFNLAIKLASFVDWSTVKDANDVSEDCKQFCRNYTAIREECREFVLAADSQLTEEGD